MNNQFNVGDMVVEETNKKGIKSFYCIILRVSEEYELYVYHIVGQEELNVRYSIKFKSAHARWKKVA
jgi:hypothetical protein